MTMDQEKQPIDFSWLPAEGLTFEQFAAESIERLCAGVAMASTVSHCHDSCHDCILQLALRVAAGNTTLQQLSDSLEDSSGGSVSSSDAVTLHHLAKQRSAAIRQAVLQHSLTGVPTLANFDWNVKLSVSSSRVSELHEPLLSLLLHTTTANTRGPSTATGSMDTQAHRTWYNSQTSDKTLFTELTLPQLDDLIDKLKTAQDKIVRFK